jgi:hypothetical protein
MNTQPVFYLPRLRLMPIKHMGQDGGIFQLEILLLS